MLRPTDFSLDPSTYAPNPLAPGPPPDLTDPSVGVGVGNTLPAPQLLLRYTGAGLPELAIPALRPALRSVEPPYRRPWAKPHAFALANGEGGASIWFGELVSSVSRDGDYPNVVVTAPSNLDTNHLFQTHLGWYGDVYLYWETTNDGDITFCDVRGPEEPDHSSLDGMDGGKYWVKLGTVDQDAPVDQLISSDVFWNVAILGGSSSAGSSFDETSESTNGSDKSTAIVPASSSSTGYRAWFTMEAPDVRFEDVATIRLTGRVTRTPIHPLYLEGIERSTIAVCGAVPDRPCPIGVRIEDEQVVVELPLLAFARPTKVEIKLTAIRKGFLGMHLPTRTREQFVANERFLNSAYPRS